MPYVHTVCAQFVCLIVCCNAAGELHYCSRSTVSYSMFLYLFCDSGLCSLMTQWVHVVQREVRVWMSA